MCNNTNNKKGYLKGYINHNSMFSILVLHMNNLTLCLLTNDNNN